MNMTMNPLSAISTLYTIPRSLQDRIAALLQECDEIELQWESLGATGCRREDHAASLLARLIPHLGDIATFAATCQSQINGMNADPFQRGEH